MWVLGNCGGATPPVCAVISAALRIIAGIRPGVMPSGLGISSTSAPNARIVRIFSSANASEDTTRNGYPFTAQTNASDEPVLPPVYSTTSWPGRRRPSASAASIIARAIRSLYEPVGLAASIFTQISAQPSPASWASRTTGVPPMAQIPPGRSTRSLHPARYSLNSVTAALAPLAIHDDHGLCALSPASELRPGRAAVARQPRGPLLPPLGQAVVACILR